MRVALLLLGVAVGVGGGMAEPHAAEQLVGKVVSIHDGDCLTLAVGDREVKVRLAGIDAPELGQAYGQAARRRLSALTFGKSITVATSGTDRYGRTLGDIELEGGTVAEAMVGDGLAWHYTRYSKAATLAAAEQAAKAARRGLWADPTPVPPWEWRRQGKARKAVPAASGTHSDR